MRFAAILLAFLLAGFVPVPRAKPIPPSADNFGLRLARAAAAQTASPVLYDPSYARLAYPGGDVAANRGVCADVVVRAYRALGVDLQVLVHEDMLRAFARYPGNWGLAHPDANIDHRRVPNLAIFFRRHGTVLATAADPALYRPGDLVTWLVDGSLPHIGIVAAARSADGARPLMVHNIGAGPQLEDVLFAFPITGHYRFRP